MLVSKAPRSMSQGKHSALSPPSQSQRSADGRGMRVANQLGSLAPKHPPLFELNPCHMTRRDRSCRKVEGEKRPAAITATPV
ncbi:Outer-membrane lipoprotein carrier protein [Dissostichus eleginoides]|uniref:Outer-membrane lipoprotein carrier protein n=1 Tax=Dissostichus eleginoides TaxID=100907 RepID=A0AAD9BQG0_DISEL|nr:Outer-membrane lipoprotein carrier protein [Dissostichus eleginoides]